MSASAAVANPKKRIVAVISQARVDGISSNAAISSGNDVSHTLKGESVVERSKDLSKVSLRHKKPVFNHGKPKWETMLSVLTKNCLLLAALIWVGQMIWTWTDKIPDPTNSPFMALDYEARVSEVEAFVKKTAKMFQIQLDVLDKKIGSEVENVKNVDEKMDVIENNLKHLEHRISGLDKSLGEMKDMGLVSKEEFENFWNQLKSKSSDKSDQVSNLDKIRAYARSVIEKEIEKHAADGFGRVDYALASGGARVVMHSQPYSYVNPDRWTTAFIVRRGVHADARKMLEPSFGEPGQCFPLEGSSGYVQIRLKAAIIPQAVTLEHVSKSVAYDRSSAPKEGKVFGWFEEPIDDPSRPPTWHLIARISYDLEKSNIQTFDVEPGIAGAVNVVRLEIDSNHGSSALTCIYRFRVHGYEPSSPAAMDVMQA